MDQNNFVPYEAERIQLVVMDDVYAFGYKWPIPIKPKGSLHSDMYWQIMAEQAAGAAPPFPPLWESVNEIVEFKAAMLLAWDHYQKDHKTMRTWSFKWGQTIATYENAVVWSAVNASAFADYRSQDGHWFRFMDVLDKLIAKGQEYDDLL